MSISVQCSGCEKKVKVNEQLEGKRVKCPSCGQVTVVPAVSEPNAAMLTPEKPATERRRNPAHSTSGAQENKRTRWPWYVGGGVAALCLAFGLVFYLPMIGSDENPGKKELAQGPLLPSDSKQQTDDRTKNTQETPKQKTEQKTEITRDPSKQKADDKSEKKTETPKEKTEEKHPAKPGSPPDNGALNPKSPPKEFTNSLGMKFVWIPPGNFLMGSPMEEKGRSNNETQHQVTLTKGFYMGVYTVTQEQWQEIMGKNPSFFKGEKNLPVETVSWNDCQEFIKKLRKIDAKRHGLATERAYRLPTEAEWEYTCRAGTTTPFHFGETISTEQANYNGNYIYGPGKKGVDRRKTTPVGSFPSNTFNLHDMHGNVREWCQDWYGPYPEKEDVDPQGPQTGQYRVLRGGSWVIFPDACRSACREWFVPGFRGDGCGVRVCFCLG